MEDIQADARMSLGSPQGQPKVHQLATWHRQADLDDDQVGGGEQQVAPGSKETVFLHLTSAWPGVNGLAVPLARQKQLRRDKILIPVRSGTVLSNRLPCPQNTNRLSDNGMFARWFMFFCHTHNFRRHPDSGTFQKGSGFFSNICKANSQMLNFWANSQCETPFLPVIWSINNVHHLPLTYQLAYPIWYTTGHSMCIQKQKTFSRQKLSQKIWKVLGPFTQDLLGLS